jgi:hypothetical protein
LLREKKIASLNFGFYLQFFWNMFFSCREEFHKMRDKEGSGRKEEGVRRKEVGGRRKGDRGKEANCCCCSKEKETKTLKRPKEARTEGPK